MSFSFLAAQSGFLAQAAGPKEDAGGENRQDRPAGDVSIPECHGISPRATARVIWTWSWRFPM